MNTEFITNYLNYKIEQDENYMIFTFYELRVKCNLSEEDTNRFLELSKIKLENAGYDVYLPGENYIYDGLNRIVKENELMIAIRKSRKN